MLNEIAFELSISEKQNLTFEYLSEYLEKRNIKFSNILLKMYKMLNKEELYTNVGYLFSDQYDIPTKIVKYDTDDNTQIDEQIIIKGPILKQALETIDFLKGENQVRATFVNQRRIEVFDYPDKSIIETVMNAFIHQDYSLRGSTMIKVFEEHIMISNFGGLYRDITYDDIFIGMSICRNPAIMAVFKHLNFARGFGTGIGIIRDNYNRSINYPKIRINDNVFKVILPNQHYDSQQKGDDHLSIYETSKMLHVLEELKDDNALTRSEIQQIMDISSTRCIVILQNLVKREVLETIERNGTVLYKRAR